MNVYEQLRGLQALVSWMLVEGQPSSRMPYSSSERRRLRRSLDVSEDDEGCDPRTTVLNPLWEREYKGTYADLMAPQKTPSKPAKEIRPKEESPSDLAVEAVAKRLRSALRDRDFFVPDSLTGLLQSAANIIAEDGSVIENHASKAESDPGVDMTGNALCRIPTGVISGIAADVNKDTNSRIVTPQKWLIEFTTRVLRRASDYVPVPPVLDRALANGNYRSPTSFEDAISMAANIIEHDGRTIQRLVSEASRKSPWKSSAPQNATDVLTTDDVEGFITNVSYFTAEDGVNGQTTDGVKVGGSPLARVMLCVIEAGGVQFTGVANAQLSETYSLGLAKKAARADAVRQMWPAVIFHWRNAPRQASLDLVRSKLEELRVLVQSEPMEPLTATPKPELPPEFWTSVRALGNLAARNGLSGFDLQKFIEASKVVDPIVQQHLLPPTVHCPMCSGMGTYDGDNGEIVNPCDQCNGTGTVTQEVKS